VRPRVFCGGFIAQAYFNAQPYGYIGEIRAQGFYLGIAGGYIGGAQKRTVDVTTVKIDMVGKAKLGYTGGAGRAKLL
jgi:hypothetical protein